MELRVLIWNLMHGRSVPPSGRDLFDDFAQRIASWEWDVALLQEVPPWWPEPLAQRAGASSRLVLTSRNALLALRRRVARWHPDLMKSNGGGSNAILVRDMPILEHRWRRLSLLPERRWVHAVRLEALWVANVHLQGSEEQARAAADATRRWAGEDPMVLGGDFNLASVPLSGFAWAGGCGVDHVLVRGVHPERELRVLDRGVLSDHAPVLVRVRLGERWAEAR